MGDVDVLIFQRRKSSSWGRREKKMLCSQLCQLERIDMGVMSEGILPELLGSERGPWQLTS